MKKIEDFKKNEIKMASFFGGRSTNYGTNQTKTENGCEYHRTDYYSDSNNNHLQDSNEPCAYGPWKEVCC